MSKQPKYTNSEFPDDAGVADSPLTRSLQTSVEPTPAPAPAPPTPTDSSESEEDFYLSRYLSGFSSNNVSLPFKTGLQVTPINSHIVEGMRTSEGQPMIISTAGCFDINGLKLSFKYVRTGENTRAAIDNGWVLVRKGDHINNFAFSELFDDAAFNSEGGCITEGGSHSHATGRSYGEELILCVRPFASYVAQHKAQVITSSRKLKAIGNEASDADAGQRIAELCANRGIDEGAVRPMVTSKGWSGVSRASMTKD